MWAYNDIKLLQSFLTSKLGFFFFWEAAILNWAVFGDVPWFLAGITAQWAGKVLKFSGISCVLLSGQFLEMWPNFWEIFRFFHFYRSKFVVPNVVDIDTCVGCVIEKWVFVDFRRNVVLWNCDWRFFYCLKVALNLL